MACGRSLHLLVDGRILVYWVRDQDEKQPETLARATEES